MFYVADLLGLGFMLLFYVVFLYSINLRLWMVVEMHQVGYLAKSCSLMVSSLVWVPLGAAHHFPSGL